MPDKGKWPFDMGDSDSARESSRAAEREQARLAAEAAQRQHARHDRLIVGGRAHTKKHGLS